MTQADQPPDRTPSFGEYLRACRTRRQADDPSYSLRKVADRIGVSAAFLSRIERDDGVAGEDTIKRLAEDLGEDPDVLLAMTGKVSSELQAIIQKRPVLFGQMLREMKDAPSHALLRVVREVRDGDW